MSESTTLSFVIRDGLEDDISGCLALDHSYETEHVWQVNIVEEERRFQVTFKTERLPRTLEAEVSADAARLHAALADDQCFLVAVNRHHPEMLGYLTLRCDSIYQAALVQDLVVSRSYRRRYIGARLLNVARQWAREHDLTRLTVELATKNYPAIVFCQHAGLVFCGFNDHYFPNGDIAVFFSQSLR